MTHFWLGVSGLFLGIMYILKAPLSFLMAAFPCHCLIFRNGKQTTGQNPLAFFLSNSCCSCLLFTTYCLADSFVHSIPRFGKTDDLIAEENQDNHYFTLQLAVASVLYITEGSLILRMFSICRKHLPPAGANALEALDIPRKILSCCMFPIGGFITLFMHNIYVVNVCFAFLILFWVIVVDSIYEVQMGRSITNDQGSAYILSMCLLTTPVLVGSTFEVITSLVVGGQWTADRSDDSPQRGSGADQLLSLVPIALWGLVICVVYVGFDALARRALEPRHRPAAIFLVQLLAEL